jgi:hypothetical protein
MQMAPEIGPRNEEIEKALEEFERKNQEEAARNVPKVPQKAKTSNMADWLMRHSGGLVKEEGTAIYILAGFAILAIAVSLLLLLSGGPDIPKEALRDPARGLPEED